MRVLLVTGSFPPMPCGAGDHACQLALALTGLQGVAVAVLTSRDANNSSVSTDFEFFPIIQSWELKELRTVISTLRAWRPDVVHIHYPTVGYGDKILPFLLPLFVWAFGFRVVQTWHCMPEFKLVPSADPLLQVLGQGLVPSGIVLTEEYDEQAMSVLERWLLRNKAVRYIPLASNIPRTKLDVRERECVRRRYAKVDSNMVVYFGFMLPHKRVELLFQIADPEDSHLVLIGGALSERELLWLDEENRQLAMEYPHTIAKLAKTDKWKRKVTITGFLPADEVAKIMCAADAVVLPYENGAMRNFTSLRAAQAQGTFVLSTANAHRGYSPAEHTYYADPHDLDEMRRALKEYRGQRSRVESTGMSCWTSIGESHMALYRELNLTEANVH